MWSSDKASPGSLIFIHSGYIPKGRRTWCKMSVPVILLGVGMFIPEGRADTAELMFRVAWSPSSVPWSYFCLVLVWLRSGIIFALCKTLAETKGHPKLWWGLPNQLIISRVHFWTTALYLNFIKGQEVPNLISILLKLLWVLNGILGLQSSTSLIQVTCFKIRCEYEFISLKKTNFK